MLGTAGPSLSSPGAQLGLRGQCLESSDPPTPEDPWSCPSISLLKGLRQAHLVPCTALLSTEAPSPTHSGPVCPRPHPAQSLPFLHLMLSCGSPRPAMRPSFHLCHWKNKTYSWSADEKPAEEKPSSVLTCCPGLGTCLLEFYLLEF